MAPVYLVFSIQFHQHSLIPERLNSKVKSQSQKLSAVSPKCKTSILEIKTKSTDPTNTNDHV
jgi:hypothetical protein